MLFFTFVVLVSMLCYVGFPIYADQVEIFIFKTFLKKDEKRLNKIRVRTSNVYANNKEQYENFF